MVPTGSRRRRGKLPEIVAARASADSWTRDEQRLPRMVHEELVGSFTGCRVVSTVSRSSRVEDIAGE